MPTSPFSGLLVIDKPRGITSRDAVDRAQAWFPRGVRLGHTGEIRKRFLPWPQTLLTTSLFRLPLTRLTASAGKAIGRKAFFFEKKKQKTFPGGFAPDTEGIATHWKRKIGKARKNFRPPISPFPHSPAIDKRFLVLFFKKEQLASACLSLRFCARRGAIPIVPATIAKSSVRLVGCHLIRLSWLRRYGDVSTVSTMA